MDIIDNLFSEEGIKSEEAVEEGEMNIFDNTEEDLNIDEDLDIRGLDELGEIEGEDLMQEAFEIAMFLEEQSKFAKDPFDGKYFTGYLGLNPLTVYKENIEVLKSTVYLNFDQNKLSFLLEDLNRFTDGIKYLEIHEKDNYNRDNVEERKEMEKEIRNIAVIHAEMRKKIEMFNDLYNIKAYKIEDSEMGRKEVTTENLAKNKDIQNMILDRATSRPASKDKEIIRLKLIESVDELTNILEAIESYITFTKDSDEKYGERVKRYVSNTYRYSEEEERLLKKLRFPMVYKNREHLEKIVPNLEDLNKDKSREIVLEEHHKKRIYNMYNVLNVLDKLSRSEGRPSDLFKD